MAISVTLPFNITNGTLADASQVMANFNQIVSVLLSNGAASGANADITSLTDLASITPPSGTLTVNGILNIAGGEILLNGAPPVTAFKNRLINGNFDINQRGVSGTVTLASGVYGHDRWKAGPSGCTYTFAQNGIDTQITITAGTLTQVIEAGAVEGGSYCMSWSGTSAGSIAGGASGTSPVTATGVTVDTALTVSFGTGTLGTVQLEPGIQATGFERRPITVEQVLCQRYYLQLSGAGYYAPGMCGSGSVVSAGFSFPVPMRTSPSLGGFNSIGAFSSNLTLESVVTAAINGSCPTGSALTLGFGSNYFTAGNGTQIFGAGGSAYVGFTAEL